MGLVCLPDNRPQLCIRPLRWRLRTTNWQFTQKSRKQGSGKTTTGIIMACTTRPQPCKWTMSSTVLGITLWVFETSNFWMTILVRVRTPSSSSSLLSIITPFEASLRPRESSLSHVSFHRISIKASSSTINSSEYLLSPLKIRRATMVPLACTGATHMNDLSLTTSASSDSTSSQAKTIRINKWTT